MRFFPNESRSVGKITTVFLDFRQTICAKDQDIFKSTVFQFIQYREPVFRAFVTTDLNNK